MCLPPFEGWLFPKAEAFPIHVEKQPGRSGDLPWNRTVAIAGI